MELRQSELRGRHLQLAASCFSSTEPSAGVVKLERRRWDRLPLAIPLFVRGTDPNGEAFLEFSTALNISAGGLLLAMRRDLDCGASISLETPGSISHAQLPRAARFFTPSFCDRYLPGITFYWGCNSIVPYCRTRTAPAPKPDEIWAGCRAPSFRRAGGPPLPVVGQCGVARDRLPCVRRALSFSAGRWCPRFAGRPVQARLERIFPAARINRSRACLGCHLMTSCDAYELACNRAKSRV